MVRQKFYFTGNSLSKRSLLSAIGSMVRGKSAKSRVVSHNLLAEYFHVDPGQVFMLSAGRMAVFALLKSMELNPSDEVVVAGYTCVVLTNAVKFAGQPLKYVDIKTENFNFNTQALRGSISDKTKVLVVPHNFGIPYHDIREIKREFPSLVIIEDVAHSFGSKDKNGQLCGTIGDASFFSLEYSKPLTAGMGGVLIINNPALIPNFQAYFDQLESARTKMAMRILLTLSAMILSRSKKTSFFHINSLRFLRRSKLGYATSKKEVEGIMPKHYPTRIHPLLTCLLVPQLRNIQSINRRKDRIAGQYNALFSEFRSIQRLDTEDAVMVRYPVLCNGDITLDRIDGLKRDALTCGYRFGEWFNDVVHPKGSYRFMYQEGSCPVGEWVADRILNLPINAYHALDEKELQEIKNLFLKHGIQ